ncbi:MAG: hypothetical protein EAZ63_01380 [Runella slithyformis]|nr:MAG: hypothetical protein EAZ63_01380 [Runella slithyformis]
MNGVKVILWTGTSAGPVAKRDSILTSGNGGYLFTNLPNGTYFVRASVPTSQVYQTIWTAT